MATLRGERDVTKDKIKLDNEIATLTRQLTDLEITFDREKEKWDREKREVEHMVGLQRQRGEFETESASREAKLDVREENLEADKARFDEHVKFIEARFEQQFTALNNLMEKLLERMPTTRQLISVGDNGARSDDG